MGQAVIEPYAPVPGQRDRKVHGVVVKCCSRPANTHRIRVGCVYKDVLSAPVCHQVVPESGNPYVADQFRRRIVKICCTESKVQEAIAAHPHRCVIHTVVVERPGQSQFPALVVILPAHRRSTAGRSGTRIGLNVCAGTENAPEEGLRTAGGLKGYAVGIAD